MTRRAIVLTVGAVCVVSVLFCFFAATLVQRADKFIVDIDDIKLAQAVLVLGAGIKESGAPSDVLRDRLLTAIEVYERGYVDKILLSGDNGQVVYDEVNVMREFILNKGIPAEDIFLDHAGFSTYDSMVRAREIFGAESLIVVTQRFHLPRALYIGEKNGMTVQGVVADRRPYLGATALAAREWLASVKAFVNVKVDTPPRYLGENIDLGGDGRTTWDEGLRLSD